MRVLLAATGSQPVQPRCSRSRPSKAVLREAAGTRLGRFFPPGEAEDVQRRSVLTDQGEKEVCLLPNQTAVELGARFGQLWRLLLLPGAALGDDVAQ